MVQILPIRDLHCFALETSGIFLHIAVVEEGGRLKRGDGRKLFLTLPPLYGAVPPGEAVPGHSRNVREHDLKGTEHVRPRVSEE